MFHIAGDTLGWGWLRLDNMAKQVTRIGMESGDDAAYVALIDVLKSVDHGSHVLIKTNSMLVYAHFHGKRVYKQPRFREFRNEAMKLIKERELEVELVWVDEYHHLVAGMFRPRRRRTWFGA